jgi:hypothetical protein
MHSKGVRKAMTDDLWLVIGDPPARCSCYEGQAGGWRAGVRTGGIRSFALDERAPPLFLHLHKVKEIASRGANLQKLREMKWL